VSGSSDVESAIGSLVSLGHSMDVTVRHVLRRGDVALLLVDWEIAALSLRGTATDVAQLQDDGTWRCVIDNPHGGAREVAGMPPA
jgi:ketosteroid isomerase-like protein